MLTLLLTFVIFLLAFGGLAVGILLGRPPIKGSCGGVNCRPGIDCGACGRRSKGNAR